MENTLGLEKIYPLAPMQEGMLLQYLMEKESTAYCEQSTFTVKGDLDRALLEESFNRLIKRHEVLRTVFIHEGIRRPVQVVLNQCPIHVAYEAIDRLTKRERLKYLNAFESREREKGFDPTKAPLTRLTVIKLAEALYKVVWSFHHIIMDGWCMGIVMAELLRIYESLRKGSEPSFNEVHQYSDYIHWLEKQNEKEALRFWRQYLDGYQQKAGLPKVQKTLGKGGYSLRERDFTLDEELTSKLQALAKSCHTTLNVLIQSLWGLLLGRYNNTADVVFGTVVSGRPASLEGVESIVGLFINTIPSRVRISDGQTFIELVKEVQESVLKVKPYEYCSLAKIQAENALNDNLFDHLLAFENYPGMDELNQMSTGDAKSLSFGAVKSFEQTNYPFNLIVIPGNQLKIKLNYNSRVYDPLIIKMIEGHIKTLITGIVADPAAPLREINILTAWEKQRILVDCNGTKTDFPDKTIHELFEAEVAKTPENIAVVDEERQLTYRELNQKANRLAGLLRSKGVKPDTIVAIVVERSAEMIVGILGILKAGGAYLPIDPEYPEERIRFMLKDSRTAVIVTQRHLKQKYHWDQDMIDLEDEANYRGSGFNLEVVNRPQDLAYVIYTSGSTGRPKGVMIEHHSLVNLATWHNRFYDVTQYDESTQYAGCGFDASVWEIFPYLTAGATVHIIGKVLQLDLHKLNQYYEKKGITISFLPTPICERFLDLENHSLRALLTGGDKLRKYEAKGYRIFNNYGPTENTVVTTSFLVERNYDNIPIGKPNANVRIYILDQYEQLQPTGVAGELCIAGEGLARGYLNRPELTAAQFVANPFCPGAKLYRTGDLARWLPDGNIEFLGRIDHQIKLRGFRIELGEIENRFFGYPGIKEVAVTVREYGEEKNLCVYFVADTKIDWLDIREYLREKLPVYMIPTRYLQLPKMPLNNSGKIDREMLPDISPGKDVREGCQRSSTETEKKLTQIWSFLLGNEQIELDANFFDIGGNSILTISMHSRIEELFKVKISIADLFANPTIAKLARHIDAHIAPKQRNLTVERLKLPEDYFNHDQPTATISNFVSTLEEQVWEKLSQIATGFVVEPEVILLCINGFVYHKLSAENEIFIQTMLKSAGEVYPLRMDFSSMKNFYDLFTSTSRTWQENYNSHVYPVSEIAGSKNTSEGDYGITPFFTNQELGSRNENLPKLFDVCISVEKNSTDCKIQCGYNPEKLNSHSVEELFNAYIRTVNLVAGKYQFNQERKKWSV
jgi:amino acid adenylation domain-containing protein